MGTASLDAFVEGEPIWNQPVDNPEQPRANVVRIVERLEPLVEKLQARLRAGTEVREADLLLYEDTALYLLFERYHRRFFEAGFGPKAGKDKPARWRFYSEFLADWRHFFLSRFITIVYSRTRSYEETARRLRLDRRTVKAKIDAEMLTRLKQLQARAGRRRSRGSPWECVRR